MVQRPLWFGSFSASMALIVLCGGALVWSAHPVAAQPQVPLASGAFVKGAPQAPELKQQVLAFRSEIAQLARTQPEAVAARVDEFVRSHPAIAWSDAALFLSAKAAAQHKQGQVEAALQTYRAALIGFDAKEPQKAWAAADLLKGEARVLLGQKDAQGAAQLLGDNWPILVLSNANRNDYAWRSTQEAVKTYVAALDAAGHKAQVPDILAGHLLQSPSLLEFAGQDNDLGALLLDIISQRLNQAKRGAEVVSWGRLRYASCRYEVEALDGATLFLGRAWNDKAKAQEFGNSQREANSPNPLQAVEPPKLLATEAGREFVKMRASEMEAELAQTGDASLVPDLVGLYLASEQPGAAMAWAWRGAQSNPGEPNSIGQVCRVFKAADLDLVRAEQFVAWSEGKAENPVPQFLAQHADAANVAAAKLKPRRERKAREKATLADEWQSVRQAPRGVLLGLVNLGALQPRIANEAGALQVDDTIRLIQDQRVRNYMSIPDREVIRLGLGEVLEAQLAALPPKEQPTVPPLVQLALADAKRKRGDAGAVPIYESLIAAAEKRNAKGFDKQSIVPLAHLAMFYGEQGQSLKEAQTWSRWKDVPTSDEWNADWRVMAALAYSMTGQDEKASELYAQVPQYGSEKFTVIALCRQATIEMQKGNSVQARQILVQSTSTDSPFVKLTVSLVAAHSYYVDGEFAESRKLFTQVIDQAQKAQGSTDKKDEALRRASTAKEHLRLIEQWTETPLVCEPSQFSVRAPTSKDEPVTRWLYVSSFRDVPLKVESNNPFITVKKGQKQWEDDEQLQYNQEFEVTVAAEAKQLTASRLTITSARFPNVQVQVPLQFTSFEGGDTIENSPEKKP